MAAAKGANTDSDPGFQKVTNKKKKTMALHPEYTRLNRKVMVETEGPLPIVTNEEMLQVVNNATEGQGFKFQCVT